MNVLNTRCFVLKIDRHFLFLNKLHTCMTTYKVHSQCFTIDIDLYNLYAILLNNSSTIFHTLVQIGRCFYNTLLKHI